MKPRPERPNPAPTGIRAARVLRARALKGTARGGNERPPDGLERGGPRHTSVLADAYTADLEVKNYAAATVRRHGDSLRRFILWAQERDLPEAGDFTRPILESYQRHLWRARKKNGKPLGVGHQREQISVLRKFFGWLCRGGHLPSNPAADLELPRPEARLPEEPLTRRQVEAVLAAPDVGDPLGVRDRAILELFYSAGLRRSELARLGAADLNHEKGTLHVRLGKGKKDRYVPVGARAYRWVRKYLDEVRPQLELEASGGRCS